MSSDDEFLRFPRPFYDSGVSVESKGLHLGQFDPHSCVLWLDTDVANSLDTRGGELPKSSVEPPNSPAMRGFSTKLHESIHWWQHIGTTAGWIYTLTGATQALSTLGDVRKARHAHKPILQAASGTLPHAHPITQTALRWLDVEHGRVLLLDPRLGTIEIENRNKGFISTGHSLLFTCIEVASTLGSAFDPSFAGLVDPRPWFEIYSALKQENRTGFEPGDLVAIPLGLQDLAEGQARICEIQHRQLTQESITWAEVRERHGLDQVYGRAFDLFLKMAELPEPEAACDASVNLFLLLCDIALNPAVGVVEPVTAEREFLFDFHPGVRFMKLCRRCIGDSELLHRVESPSCSNYEWACKRLCEREGWQTPTEIAKRIVDRWDKSRDGSVLDEQRENRSYPASDCHLRFLVGEHRAFMRTKIQVPHMFCWPAWMLIVGEGEDEAEHARGVAEILDWHEPPFTASSISGSLDSVGIADFPRDQLAQFLSDYFATIALYELSRQWIFSTGPFKWTAFPWKRPLSETDVNRLKDRFEASFGIKLDDIHFG